MEERVPALFSKTLVTKSCSYFFDVRQAKNNSKYLMITESKASKEGKKYRATVMVFENNLKEFMAALSELADKV